MRSTGNSAVSSVLVLIAAASLLSMIGLLQIDKIVNQDLYRYGLQFSYGWSMPYHTFTTVMFAAGWFNIIAAIAFSLYVVAYRQRGTEQPKPKAEKEILKTEIPEKIQTIMEEKTETETKPAEKIEEQKEPESKPTENLEQQPKQTPVSAIEPETQEKKEETQTVIEETPSQGQTESKQSESVEGQKEQGPETPRESEAEQKETKPETQEKSEEAPPTIEETQQQVGTSVL